MCFGVRNFVKRLLATTFYGTTIWLIMTSAIILPVCWHGDSQVHTKYSGGLSRRSWRRIHCNIYVSLPEMTTCRNYSGIRARRPILANNAEAWHIQILLFLEIRNRLSGSLFTDTSYLILKRFNCFWLEKKSGKPAYIVAKLQYYIHLKLVAPTSVQ